MSVLPAYLKILLMEAKRKPFSGSLLTLGRHDVLVTFETLIQMAANEGVSLKEPGEFIPSHKSELRAQDFISDITLFKCLGFDEVRSLDYSEYESADILFDLNSVNTPEELVNRFDVVIDIGVIEHVFNVPNTLKHNHNFLKIGGRIIHFVPASNYIDTCYFMFSPCFFMEYYEENGYVVNQMYLNRETNTHSGDGLIVMHDYLSGEKENYRIGELPQGMYTLFSAATKTAESTRDKIPLQNAYRNKWISAGKTQDARKSKLGASPIHALQLFLNYKKTVQDYLEHISSEGITSIAIYGFGTLGEIVLLAAQSIENLRITAIIDGSVEKQGTSIFGHSIISLSSFKAEMCEAIIITAPAFSHISEIKNAISARLQGNSVKVLALAEELPDWL